VKFKQLNLFNINLKKIISKQNNQKSIIY
jgi:hypothetical protein